MANHKLLIPFIQKWEGGFANDPDDAGGATMAGVTIDTYTEYCRRKGKPVPTIDDLKKITEAEWNDIFKTLYWDRWKADSINNQSLANILVDWVWGSGKWGIIIPQRILGVVADGIVGPKTITALNSANQEDLFYQIRQARLNFVDNIVREKPTQKKFIRGWKNRINYFEYKQ